MTLEKRGVLRPGQSRRPLPEQRPSPLPRKPSLHLRHAPRPARMSPPAVRPDHLHPQPRRKIPSSLVAPQALWTSLCVILTIPECADLYGKTLDLS